MKWHECFDCEKEFRVICSDEDAVVEFCPLCGAATLDEEVEDIGYDDDLFDGE